MNLGIVIGVDKYHSDIFDDLVACKNDARVMHDVLINVKDFEEILFINETTSGQEVKRNIANFVEKYKEKDVKELVFYFTGHGERYEDDFFYLLSDFDRSKRETTGLRNSELDEWIKTLSPKLCVKIVDACFSGTQYIKSESTEENDLKKSAQKYGLNDIYFWFSSRENEASFAGSEFSKFTESILTAITEQEGDVRYREIMAYVADDFSNAGSSKPIFVTQAGNIERFGHVTKQTHQIIFDAFGISTPKPSEESKKDNTTTPNEAPVKSIFDKAIEKSNRLCFSEEFLLTFIENFNSEIVNWNSEVNKLYEIEANHNIECYSVPNAKKIGTWLDNNSENNYFASPTYDTRKYETEEYKPLPKKPSRSISSAAMLRGMGLWREPDETEYKLETVTKTERFIDGFEYTHSAEKRIVHISFTPKIEMADPISLYIILIYSNREMVINFSYESLKRLNWKSYSYPKCSAWKTIKFNINSSNSHVAVSGHIKKDFEGWLTESLSKNID
ncbi:TPA: caspase family protein [Aeromonas hydrophila]|nr:caspase family protein [Aeromonas hydrophila]